MIERAKAPPGGLRYRLRDATRSLHQEIDHHFDLDRLIAKPFAYCALLENLWRLYRPLEKALLPLKWENCNIAMAERCRTRWLEQDLTHFDIRPRQTVTPTMPRLEHVADGLGILYVLEGSTLGGQIILKALTPSRGISPQAGGRFFASYGKKISAMWRSYIEALETFGGTPDIADRIEAAARETFALFVQHLEQKSDTISTTEVWHAHA